MLYTTTLTKSTKLNPPSNISTFTVCYSFLALNANKMTEWHEHNTNALDSTTLNGFAWGYVPHVPTYMIYDLLNAEVILTFNFVTRIVFCRFLNNAPVNFCLI